MLMSFVLPFIEFEDGVSNPLLLFHSTFSLFFFGQPIWRVTRSLDRVNDRVGFQNYGYNMWGKHYTFPHNYFFLWFSPKLSFTIWFFNIELVKNYSYNMWGKHCTLHRKLLWIDTVFFPIKFFFCFFMFFF